MRPEPKPVPVKEPSRAQLAKDLSTVLNTWCHISANFDGEFDDVEAGPLREAIKRMRRMVRKYRGKLK